jgi:Protein of unknown function (DUF1326)/Copper binding proteins, plastocyanin/azurin family
MFDQKIPMSTLQQIPNWTIKADYIETCNCDYGCPCNFTGFPSNGFCRALVGYDIREGKYGDTVNERVFDPFVIDVFGNAKVMKPNANYTITGTEKYVNSGWLLPKGQEKVFPGSSNTFTVTFEKAGRYDYFCMVHPWMFGTVIVK